jgi:alpha-glucosidase
MNLIAIQNNLRFSTRMKWATRLVTILGFGSVCLHLARADAPLETLSDGVGLKINGMQVELRVASPHAFRLHVSVAPRSNPAPSIFLSGATRPDTPFTVTHDGDVVGIKTAFGELQVDPDKGLWSLRDAAGGTLADWAALPSSLEAGNALKLAAGAPSPAPSSSPLFYGSGNVPSLGALSQKSAPSHPGNGSTALPQFWSTAGYGALMVSDVDNQPASWSSNPGGAITWTVPGANADLYLAPAANLYDWLRDDAELTGFAPVPPRWAFGYMQSRWGWENKAYIDDTFARFRQDHLPVDVFIIDFEWYTSTPDYSVPPQGDPKFQDFSWNPSLFPDPANQIAAFGAQGLHIVGIRKPRLGNSDNLAMARGKGWILQRNPLDPNGGVNITSRNLDYANPDVRAYWEENNRKFIEAGMAGFWNDEGETTFTEYSYWNLAENELFHTVNPEQRFWSLNRSFDPGLQRFGAAAWTGDIASDWPTLAKTTGELLSYSLSGMPYDACDIGGYAGTPTPELLARWMEAGVFFPVYRSHSERSQKPRFPWLYDEPAVSETQAGQPAADAGTGGPGGQTENAIRQALDLRYRLVPYYYSLAFQNNREAAPLMRPLVMEFPQDAKVAGLTDEWLMGRGLLAAPLLTPGGTRSVYLPQDNWFTFGTNQVTTGPQTISVTAKLEDIPVYVRAGTILPLGPVLQYTGQPTTEPLELQVYPGHDATFDLVQDDGATLAYQKGLVRHTLFTWNDQTRTLSWKVSGPYSGDNLFHAVKFVLFAPQGVLTGNTSLDAPGTVQFR